MRRNTTRGATAIEMGLLLPVLVGLFCAFIEFGWVLYQRTHIVRVVHNTCRTVALDPMTPQHDMVAKQKIFEELRYTNLCKGTECRISGEILGSDKHDQILSCTAVVPMEPVTGFLPLKTWTLRAGTTVRMEWRGTR